MLARGVRQEDEIALHSHDGRLRWGLGKYETQEVIEAKKRKEKKLRKISGLGRRKYAKSISAERLSYLARRVCRSLLADIFSDDRQPVEV